MVQIFLPDTLAAAGLDAIVSAGMAGSRRPAVLRGYAVACDGADRFPTLLPGAGTAAGELIALDAPDAVARWRYLATILGCGFDEVRPEAGGRAETARALVGPARATGPSGWTEDWADIWRAAATEIMAYFGTRPAAEVEAWRPMILSRAWSRVTAGRSARRSVCGLSSGEVEIHELRRPYGKFFALEEYSLSHQRFDGGDSGPLERAVFIASDAVTVLPYDPARDRVLLVEQFRMSPLARGEPAAWILEPVAGRIEPGQSPEETAHREAEEEAGVTLRHLERVAGYYPSTGCFSEYVHSYVGIADLPDAAGGLGGLASEDEDIRAHVMARTEMMRLIAEGDIPDAPALISALWLEANLERLRRAG